MIRFVAAPAIVVFLMGAIAASLGCCSVRAEELIPPTAEEAADIATWIPAQCCRTNGCCQKVHESALISERNDNVRVRQTGQVLKRTGWSQDKNTWRCTCDFDHATQGWIVHENAHTRCVFPHFSGY